MSDPMRYTTRQRSLSDDEIVSLYRELLDSDAVGARAGCSGMTVLSIVRRAGLPVMPRGGRPGRRAPLALADDEIVRRYEAGQHARDIAADAGCSDSTIYRLLDRLGVPRRKSPVGR
jgi:DNA-binding CsgD family transcriptional regulator